MWICNFFKLLCKGKMIGNKSACSKGQTEDIFLVQLVRICAVLRWFFLVMYLFALVGIFCNENNNNEEIWRALSNGTYARILILIRDDHGLLTRLRYSVATCAWGMRTLMKTHCLFISSCSTHRLLPYKPQLEHESF